MLNQRLSIHLRLSIYLSVYTYKYADRGVNCRRRLLNGRTKEGPEDLHVCSDMYAYVWMTWVSGEVYVPTRLAEGEDSARRPRRSERIGEFLLGYPASVRGDIFN